MRFQRSKKSKKPLDFFLESCRIVYVVIDNDTETEIEMITILAAVLSVSLLVVLVYGGSVSVKTLP